MDKCVLIYFLGMDGSGKSTLSHGLYSELKIKGHNVSYIWWLEGDNSLIRKLIRKFGKIGIMNPKNSNHTSTRSNSSSYSANSFSSKVFRFLYPNIVLLDYLRFGIFNAWIPKYVGKNRIMIFDRFMYDIVLALSNEFDYPYTKTLKLFKIIDKLVPKPDLIFAIDVTPEVSYARKREEFGSLEEAKSIWLDYQNLYSFINNLGPIKIIKIDNRKSIELVKDEILKNTLDLI